STPVDRSGLESGKTCNKETDVVANFYEVLGLKADATTQDIRTAYRRLVRQHHPDVTGRSDALRFREIQLAYDTLSDAASRVRYDRSLENRVPVRIVSSRKQAAYAEPLIPQRRTAENFANRSRFSEQDAFEEIFSLVEKWFFRF